MIRTTIRSRFAKSIPVRIRICRNREEWDAVGKERGIVEWTDVAGACHTVERIDLDTGKRTLKEVEVCLRAEYIGAGYIGHEMTHAAFGVRRIMVKRDEETLALLVGDLCCQFWNWFYKQEELHKEK